MSLLSEFASSGFDFASGVIGTTKFHIGNGGKINVVPSTTRSDREQRLAGYDADIEEDIVLKTEDFELFYPDDPITYDGKNCTHDGKPRKIANIQKGKSFVKITLTASTHP